MKEYILNSQQVQVLIDTLKVYPYEQVHHVIAMLVALKPIEKEEKK